MYKVLKVELIYVRVYTYINTSTYQQVRSILNTGTDIRHIVGLLSAHGLRFDSHKISHLPISVIAAFRPPKHLLSSPSSLRTLPHSSQLRLYAWYKLRLCHEKLEHVLWSVPYS